MKYYKPLLIILLTLISVSIFAQDVDIDSLVKTHKKIAILPVRVMYSLKKLSEGTTIESMRKKEFEDGFLLQEKIWKTLTNLENPLKIDIQSPNQTNGLLTDNEITLIDLKELPSEFVCEALTVDAIIQVEVRLAKHLTDNERGAAQALGVASMIINPLNAISVFRGPKKVRNNSSNRDDKNISSKMIISDGKTGETIGEYFTELDAGVFYSSDKLIENILGRHLSKLPYIKNEK